MSSLFRVLCIFLAFAAVRVAAGELAALPKAKVTIPGQTQFKGKPESLISGPTADMLSFQKLEGAQAAIEFDSPVKLPSLAVIRYGYDDWAVPAVIEYRINGGEAQTVKLTSPRVPNHDRSKSPGAELIPLGDIPVSRIDLRVADVETRDKRYCAHGILKLAIPAQKQKAAAEPKTEGGLNYLPGPFPKAKAEALSAAVKEPEKLISSRLDELTVGDVADFAFRVTFPEPVKLPRLALLRVGWGDWAAPKTIEVKVNGEAPKTFALSSGRITPNSKATELPGDMIELGDRPVGTLEFRVASVETGGNKHGSFKLFVPVSATIPREMPEDLAATSGFTAEIELPEATAGAYLTATARRFRRPISWVRPLSPLKAGVNRITLDWNEFALPEEPETALTPGNIHQLNLVLPGGAKQAVFRVFPAKAKHAASFPEQYPMPDFSAGGDDWRNGIPAEGFGRFGYQMSNGLLTVNLEDDGIFYQTDQSFLNLRFGNGAPQETSWRKMKAGSDHMVIAQLKRFRDAKENKVTSRAFGEFDASRLPERYIASILAPGFLIDSRDSVFTVSPTMDLGTPHLLFPEKDGKLRWATGEIDLSTLSEGWALLFFEKRPGQPVLLAFDRKPQKAVREGNGIGILFGQPRGFLGIGTPAGNRHYSGTIGTTDAATARLAETSRKLAALLRNYPLQSQMKFKCTGDRVDFAEQFRFLSWRNEWGESGETYLPCPPLVSFGADQNYPVTFPEGAPEPFGLNTKYGPYRVWPLSKTDAGRYSLPLPSADNTIYPNVPSNPLSAKIAAAISTEIGDEPRQLLSGDGLGCWWMLASGAMAQPLFNPEQQSKIAANWKKRVEFVLSPRPWFRRTEPYSGISYPLSFAWTDRAQEIQGDPNSGIGATLSGLSNYARFTGDWETLAENWEMIRRIPLYFYYSHDWTMMQAGCREHTAASAIDMDVITFEGAAGLARMAKALGKEDDLAAARMLLARYALSDSMKWKALAYRRPDLPKEKWNAIGIGFNEFYGFEVMSARGKNQNYINSEIALSLAWIGDYPCFFAMLLGGNDREFWKFFEYDYVEKQLDAWRTRHPGHRNWHDANIAPHLYLRLLLGEPAADVTRELEAQKMLSPDPRMAAENAGFYALYLADGAPVRLQDWGKAKLLSFNWNKEEKRVEAEFDSPAGFALDLRLSGTPSSGPRENLSLPAGKQRIVWQF